MGAKYTVRVNKLLLRNCVQAHDNSTAKKWGDTEIAERGRSMLVMRARYTSVELTPHQRGWTDAG